MFRLQKQNCGQLVTDDLLQTILLEKELIDVKKILNLSEFYSASILEKVQKYQSSETIITLS